MNTMGKLLVFFILLVALAVGVLQVWDFTTRKNWKDEYEKQLTEFRAAQANATAMYETIIRLKNELATANQQLEKNKLEYAALQQEKQELLKAEQAKLIAATSGEKKADLNQAYYQAQMARLAQENLKLQDFIKQREDIIIALEKERDDFRQQATNAINDRDQAIERANNMLIQLQDMHKKVARAQTRSLTDKENGIASRNQPNPPPVYVRGKIERVHPSDSSLVEISIGRDAGLDVDHTLEVYRLQPRPDYLGMIRIVEVDPHKAIGRLVQTSNLTALPTLRPGDEVASRIVQR